MDIKERDVFPKVAVLVSSLLWWCVFRCEDKSTCHSAKIQSLPDGQNQVIFSCSRGNRIYETIGKKRLSHNICFMTNLTLKQWSCAKNCQIHPSGTFFTQKINYKAVHWKHTDSCFFFIILPFDPLFIRLMCLNVLAELCSHFLHSKEKKIYVLSYHAVSR